MHNHKGYYKDPHGTTFIIEEDSPTSISIMLINFACDWLKDGDATRMQQAGHDLKGILDAVDNGRGEHDAMNRCRAWLNIVGPPGMQREIETAEHAMTWLRGLIMNAAGPGGAAVHGALQSLLSQIQDNRNCIVAYRKIDIAAPSKMPLNEEKGEENTYIMDQPWLKDVQTTYDMGFSLKRVTG